MNLLLVLFLFLNGLHLILSVNEPKVGKIRPTFDEIYGKGWDEDAHQQIKVETSPLNSGENALNEQADHDDNIDQNVEAYNSDSTDQNLTQENPDRIDQSDDEINEGINDENEFSEKEKREIICKFHVMKKEYKKKGKFPATERVKIERKIGNKLGVNRDKIYKWKKEFGLSRKTKRNKNYFYEKKKREFIEQIDEIKKCQFGEQNKLINDLGISPDTFYRWKKEFGLPIFSQIKYSDSDKLNNSDSTDQNLTQEDPDRIDQSGDETIEGINDEYGFSDQEKRKIISKFHALKKEYKKKGKYLTAERAKIERKIGNKLGVNRDKIYKWKKEFGLSRKIKRNTNYFYEKKKREFIKRMDEIKKCQFGEQNKLINDLGISPDTYYRWKKEFGLPIVSQIIYSESEKLELMGKYYKIKQRNPKIKNSDIAKRLNISSVTLYNWIKQFGATFNKNSIDEHSLPKKRHFFADNDTLKHPMASSNDNLWAWNFAMKKRTERTEVEHFGNI